MPREDQYVALCEHSVSLNVYNYLCVVEIVSFFLIPSVPSCLRASRAALACLIVGRLLSCLQSALCWRSMEAVGQYCLVWGVAGRTWDWPLQRGTFWFRVLWWPPRSGLWAVLAPVCMGSQPSALSRAHAFSAFSQSKPCLPGFVTVAFISLFHLFSWRGPRRKESPTWSVYALGMYPVTRQGFSWEDSSGCHNSWVIRCPRCVPLSILELYFIK